MMEQEIFLNREVDLSTLPTQEQVTFQGLHADYRFVLIIQVAITFTVLTMGALLAWALIADVRFILTWVVVGILLLGVVSILFVVKSFPYKGYAVRERDLIYRTGWLSKRTTILPYNRVQHVDIKQGLIDRSFGLAKLNVYTAGGQSSDVTIPGLLLDDAKRLKSFVLQVVSADEEE